jgi:hypothetical protein
VPGDLHHRVRHRAPELRLPRLLADLSSYHPTGLAEHEELYGPLSLPAPHDNTGRRWPESLIDLVERSGLTGRGGAGFPTGEEDSAATRLACACTAAGTLDCWLAGEAEMPWPSSDTTYRPPAFAAAAPSSRAPEPMTMRYACCQSRRCDVKRE